MSDSTFAYAYSGQVAAAGAVLPVVGIVCVVLRFVARIGRKHGIGVDDWLSVPALFFEIGMGASLLTGVAKGVMGFPTPPAPSEDPKSQETQYLPGQALLEQLEFAFFVCMIIAYGFIKLSVLYFYRRIFASGSRTFNWVSLAAVLICAMWTLGFLLVYIFSCRAHLEYHWGPLSDQRFCVGGLKFLEGLMISDFLTDMLIFLLPFPWIWGLKMSPKRKAAVCAILALGATSLAASAARLVLQVQLTLGGYTTKTDVFLTITSILYWSMIEAGIAVIAICLPTMHSLVVDHSIQSAVASIRSALSLHSLRSSTGSRGSRQNQRPTQFSQFTSQHTTDAGIYRAESSQIDTDVEAAKHEDQQPLPLMPENAIHVDRNVSQTHTNV